MNQRVHWWFLPVIHIINSVTDPASFKSTRCLIIYLTKLSATQNMQCRNLGWILADELKKKFEIKQSWSNLRLYPFRLPGGTQIGHDNRQSWQTVFGPVIENGISLKKKSLKPNHYKYQFS